MGKKKLLTLIGSVCLILVLAALPFMGACAPKEVAPPPEEEAPLPPEEEAPPAEEVFTFTFAWNDIWGPKFRCSQVYAPGGELQRMLYERSGGRIRLNIISRMFPSTDILAAVGEGKADMGDVPMPWHSGTYPLWNWGDIPGIIDPYPVKGLAEELAIYQDPGVLEIYDKTMREIGVVYWFVTQWDPANGLWTNTKVTKLADMKGLKIRVGGYLPTEGIKAMGGSPITMATAELAPAMLTGAIDAVLTSQGYGYSIGLANVSKYFTVTPLAPTWTAVTVMNAEKYDALPPDLQKVLMDVGREVEQMVYLATVAEYIMSADTVTLSGVEILPFEPAELEKALEAVAPMEDLWLELAGPYGPELLAKIKDVVANHRAFTGK